MNKLILGKKEFSASSSLLTFIPIKYSQGEYLLRIEILILSFDVNK